MKRDPFISCTVYITKELVDVVKLFTELYMSVLKHGSPFVSRFPYSTTGSDFGNEAKKGSLSRDSAADIFFFFCDVVASEMLVETWIFAQAPR